MLNKYQKGMSPIGILFVVCVCAGLLLVVLKLSQHYLDYYSIRSVFQDQAQSPDTKNLSVDKVRENIYKQLSLNNIRDFKFDEAAYMNSDEGTLVLGFAYEVREHMVANLDVILSFEYEAEIK